MATEFVVMELRRVHMLFDEYHVLWPFRLLDAPTPQCGVGVRIFARDFKELVV